MWAEKPYNKVLLVLTVLVRLLLAASFVFYICNYLTRFTNALMISMALVAVALMVVSRSIKKHSIKIERMFIQNLRSREIEAQIKGHIDYFC